MKEITLIRLSYSNYNGFIFEILNIDFPFMKFEKSLFGIMILKKRIYMDLFFITFKNFKRYTPNCL